MNTLTSGGLKFIFRHTDHLHFFVSLKPERIGQEMERTSRSVKHYLDMKRHLLD